MNLLDLKNKIDVLPKEHHVEIAKLLIHNNVPYNENQNGIFVNLVSLPEETYIKILNYITYISTQESSLSETEEKREQLIAEHFHGSGTVRPGELRVGGSGEPLETFPRR
jgi:hypothetical protein